MGSGFKNALALGAKALLWLLTLFGVFVVAISLAQMIVLATGFKAGTALFIDGVAPTFPESIGNATFGVALAAISSILRRAIGRWQRADGSPAPARDATHP